MNTKTKEQMQAAVDEIAEVCRKHGIALQGVSYSEGGIDTEIALYEISKPVRHDVHVKLEDNPGEFYVDYIGDKDEFREVPWVTGFKDR